MWAVKQDLKNHRYLDNAKDKVMEVKTVFINIQNNFAQQGPDSTKDRHHEKFLDFTFDSLAILGILRLNLTEELRKQNVPMEQACPEANILLKDMESIYNASFKYEGEFSLQRILDQSDFNTWHNNISYHIKHSYYPVFISRWYTYENWII